ncbi:MAG: ABC transporter ATP-binding protein [Candidatus Thermoplasmatota archaeon]|nr:ABC transporter ATP-binding protein [Candidatus Thermoplasmatota archaeon]
MTLDNRKSIVQARKIVKIYDTGSVKVEALRGIDLDVKRGEMVAVMGPSGCGKTTLLNCLSGLDETTSGNVFIEGTDLARMKDDERTEYRASNMGFVFQFYNLLPVLTAVENVEMVLLLSGIKPKEARRRAEKALEIVGLKNYEKHRPSQLSGGQRQRVTLARALVNDPKIVWADEPTGDLDKKNSNEMMQMMKSLNEKLEMTFVIVTHDPDVAAVCRRIIHMEDGKIVKDVPITAKDALVHPKGIDYTSCGDRDTGSARISAQEKASM